MDHPANDYFSPRPLNARIIRFYAIAAAILLTLGINFLIYYHATPHPPSPLFYFGVRDDSPPLIIDLPLAEKAKNISILLFFNLVGLFVCWRCYLLKFWACVMFIVSSVIILPVGLIALPFVAAAVKQNQSATPLQKGL